MGDLELLALATVAAGFLRGVTGFGFALAAVPFYSLSLPPVEAVIMAQMLQIAAAPGDLIRHRRAIDARALRLLCAGALVCTPPGAYCRDPARRRRDAAGDRGLRAGRAGGAAVALR
ncbi:sulfite exporter TauE/SafE family protein, partial [Limimaricola cinnabarinus]|uniref:sulfite exporter TauE/SafE family protein n=1 Tax=Limimaricola cinnabarinus TaxID=1125964 RepID=UPI00103D61E6